MSTLTPTRRSRATAATVHRVLLGLCGIAIGLVVLLPIIWMVFTAFRPEADVVQYPPSLFPRAFTLEHFVDIWEAIPFARLYLNTIIFAGGVTIISLLFDSMMGYALARLEFRGRNAVFVLVMILLMVPFQVTLIPLYDLLGSMGLSGTLPGMIAPRMTNAFGIFFMRQFYLSLPRDLDEAARVDGASEWRIFARIITPLAKPALLTLGLFHFQYNWNDLLWPLIMSRDIASSTLPAGLAMFVGQHVVEYGLLMAGSVLALAPVVVFFLVIQKSFVAGIATTGMK
jgi:multiple sugar transport system permease protein